MKKNWQLVKLGDVCQLNYGKSLVASKRQSGNIPVYSSAGITGSHNEALVPSKGIIVGRKGVVGTVFYSSIPFFCIDTAYYIKPNEDRYDLKYLYYCLKTLGLENLNEDSAVPGLNRNTALSQKFLLPPLLEQKKIASVLSALDDKIELNNKINQNLEAQAQAIFKSWFVDFEPFKDGKFIDSELGKIPEDWRVESVYSIADVIYGAPFSSKLFNNSQLGIPIIRIRDLPNEGSNTYTTEVHPKGYLIKPGDVVVGMDGEFKAYLWGGNNAWLNQRVCVFKPKLNVSTAFIMFSIIPLLNEVENSELATTVIHLGKNDIDRFKIILPPSNILEKYNKVSIPIFDTIVKNKKESQRLAQVRDTLLPKLMSGEIDVSNLAV